ncbi:MAG: Gfo/Idh/MocA family oxidoreductase [Lentisphaerae bacterium]|nr:Gfo/Idh/MocA family oxidoreductase [Lentisphaerota bacterium]
MDKIRFGVVGLGQRGRHMSCLAADAFDCTEFVAACDVDPLLWSETQWQQEKPLKDRFPKVAFYTDYTEMLDKHEFDLILVETGADIHADFCIKALNRNINVFSDIPSVANLDEAGRLWAAEQSSRAKLMTGANPNEWGFVNTLVDLYKRGLLGEPYYMEAEYIHASRMPAALNPFMVHSPWRKTLVPIVYCTHSLGPLLRIMKEVLRYAICVGTGKHINPEACKDDMQAALFQTESGVTIRLLRNGACRAFFGHHSYRVFGTKGYFERIDSRGKTPQVVRFRSDVLYGADELTELPVGLMPNEYRENPQATGHGGGDYALLDHLFKAMLNDAPEFPITLRDGLCMTLPGLYAAKSAKLGGQKLTIHYPWEPEFAADVKMIDQNN